MREPAQVARVEKARRNGIEASGEQVADDREVADVRHAHEEHSSGGRDAPRGFERGDRVLEVLENVREDDRVESLPGEREVGQDRGQIALENAIAAAPSPRGQAGVPLDPGDRPAGIA